MTHRGAIRKARSASSRKLARLHVRETLLQVARTPHRLQSGEEIRAARPRATSVPRNPRRRLHQPIVGDHLHAEGVRHARAVSIALRCGLDTIRCSMPPPSAGAVLMKVFGQTAPAGARRRKGARRAFLQPLFNIEDSLAASLAKEFHAFRSTYAGSTIETLFSSMRRFSAMAITSSLVTAAAISSLRKRFIPRKW